MRSEISQAKRESRHYVESVEKSRMLDAIRERKRKQRREEEVGVSSDGRGIFSHPEQGYKQRKVSKEDAEESRQRFPRSLLRKVNCRTCFRKPRLFGNSVFRYYPETTPILRNETAPC